MSATLFRPFKAVRPVPEKAQDVVAPPYDVLNSAEAKQKAQGKPYSFLHVSKAEIDLPDNIDPYSSEVYAKSAENYKKMIANGVLKQDEKPCYYVYRATWGTHVQTGLAVAASVQAYNENRIKRHELTRIDKENDRVRQIDALNSQTGPVLLACENDKTIAGIIAKTVEKPCAYDVEGDNGTRHALWVIDDDTDIAAITGTFDKFPAVYIADGHHRSAAASRVAKARAEKNPNHTGTEDYNYFLAVVFFVDEMKILDYNRVVKDLNGLSPEEFFEQIEEKFAVTPLTKAEPVPEKRVFHMYFRSHWYRLAFKETPVCADAVAALDVSLLTDYILKPVLAVGDLRTDKRIDFIGGMRGLGELETLVNSKTAEVAFALYPTQMEDLIAVADSGRIMPPKSTWFEPKLADGMASNPIEA